MQKKFNELAIEEQIKIDKKLKIKGKEYEDTTLNIDDYICNKFDPLRINYKESETNLRNKQLFEDDKYKIDLKENPKENLFKKKDFIKA